MKKTFVTLFTLMLMIAGCSSSQITSYDKGVKEMIAIQSKYGVDFQQTPVKDAIPSLKSELEALDRKIVANEDTKALQLLVDYRLLSLESDRLLLEGFKWGEASTTEPGFGCRRGSERILNSSYLRSAAATQGLASVQILQQLIDEYPDKAAAVNLTQRTVVSLNANYAIIEKQALGDKDTVEGFCEESIVIAPVDGGYHVVSVDDEEDA